MCSKRADFLYIDPSETLCDLEGVVGNAFAFHGVRVELIAGTTWTGSGITVSMEDLLKTKAVLHISIIPDSTWWGFTEANDCQVKAIAKVSMTFLSQPRAIA